MREELDSPAEFFFDTHHHRLLYITNRSHHTPGSNKHTPGVNHHGPGVNKRTPGVKHHNHPGVNHANGPFGASVSSHTPGLPLANDSFVATLHGVLFNISGSAAMPVQNIVLSGLVLRDTRPTYLDPHGLPSG